jgi:DNA-binding response OmpR family regulator
MPKRILVIDDDPDVLEILNLLFKEEGYEVDISDTGEEVDSILDINPDLVLLDVRIEKSGKNGADLCVKIKSRPETQHLPVILCSSEKNLEKISRNCGADDYIGKPFEISTLMTKVKGLLAA